MKEFFTNLLNQPGGLIGTIIAVVIMANAILVALSAMLQKMAEFLFVFKDKTTTELDNKVYDAISKVCAILAPILVYAAKLVEFINGNRKVVPSASAVEVKALENQAAKEEAKATEPTKG